MEISINTPALLFPAITLLMLAYTNRFLALSSLVRSLHAKYNDSPSQNSILVAQLKNLRKRLYLIRSMQLMGVVSFFICVLCMILLYFQWLLVASYLFMLSLCCLLVSLLFSIREIYISTRAIEIELSDMES
jgi:hypothetical protein